MSRLTAPCCGCRISSCSPPARSALAGRSLVVVIGYQVYELTHDKLALGWLGLVEAIPGPVAGELLVVTSRIAPTAAASSYLRCWWKSRWPRPGPAVAGRDGGAGVPWLYAVIFVLGIARGFADPAVGRVEAQVVPQALVKAAAWQSSVWQAGQILGMSLGGFALDLLGPAERLRHRGRAVRCGRRSIWCVAPRPKPIPPGRADFSAASPWA